MQLVVHGGCGSRSSGPWIYSAVTGATVGGLVSAVAAREGIEPTGLRLVNSGRDLQHRSDDTALSSLWLKEGDFITVLYSLPAGAKKGKKGKGKKKGKKGKKEEEPEPVSKFEAYDSETLRQHQQSLTTELDETAKERCYFQLERDQVQSFHDIVHKEVVDTRLHVKNLEAQMELMQTNHRNSIRMYVQKVKHLEYDHKNTINAVSMEMAMLQDEEAKEHASRKEKLKFQKQALQRELRKEQLANEAEVKNLQVNQSKEMVALRQQFERNFEKLKETYLTKMETLKEDLELQRRMEIHEIEERKNLHINDLVRNHDQAFTKIREYYNAITKDNLSLIKALKEELAELKEQTLRHEKRYEEIAKDNKKLSGPLSKAESEVEDCKKKLVNYEKDKRSLKAAKTRLVTLNQKLVDLSGTHKNLKEEYDTLNSQREQLEAGFQGAVDKVASLRKAQTEALGARVLSLHEKYDAKRAQLQTVLREANLDSVVVNNVTRRLEDVIGTKNQQIEAARLEIARVSKAHDDLVRVYEAKLPELGIDPKHLKMQTLNASGTTPAPAGLVHDKE